MSLPAIIGVLAQAETAVETTSISSGGHTIIYLIMQADWVIKLTTLVLIGFSVATWAIIGSKHRQLKKAKERSIHFFKLFDQAKSIDAIVAKGSFRRCPAFNIFKAGIDTLRDHQDTRNQELIGKEIMRTADDEIEQMEHSVPFLATTGSAAPFIGLFGTVWGILHAFWKIGRTGASSLAVIGPHIAEALVTTAIGLATAIPAVIFYNLYVNRIRLISKDLYDFADDLNTRIDHEYSHKK